MLKNRNFILTLILAIGAIQLGSCKKSESSGSDDISSVTKDKGRIYCTVDGKLWLGDLPSKKHQVLYSDGSFAVWYDYFGMECNKFGDTLNFSSVKVSGTDSSMIQLQISLRDPRVGNYTIGAYPPINAGKASALYYPKFNPSMTKLGYSGYNTTGTLNITAYSDSLSTVSGTFNFTMVPKNPGNPLTPSTRTVKSGEFTDVKFQ